MSAMKRRAWLTVLSAAILSLFLIPLRSQAQDVNQQLRDQYEGKTFLLRGFPAGDRLRYDSSGLLQNGASGDWTTDGFVQVSDIHLSDDRLVIKAQRMVAAWLPAKQFELRPLERGKGMNQGKELVRVEIKADTGMHNPSPEHVDAILSKIFLTPQDSLADLVPEYWKACVSGGVQRAAAGCAFAPELLAIPGIEASGISYIPLAKGTSAEASDPQSGSSRMPRGTRPPRTTYSPEPEFSEAARVAKYQGTVALSLMVDKDGVPTNVRITRAVGYGLDAKAVKAVESWTFAPAEKDGLPVPAQIVVEVNFHLY